MGARTVKKKKKKKNFYQAKYLNIHQVHYLAHTIFPDIVVSVVVGLMT